MSGQKDLGVKPEVLTPPGGKVAGCSELHPPGQGETFGHGRLPLVVHMALLPDPSPLSFTEGCSGGNIL